MGSRRVTAVFRLVVAALSLAAVATQLAVSVANGYSIVNFFSYFTNLSNLFGSAVFVVGAVLLLRRPSRDLDARWRGAAVVYLVLVGVVFNLLLRDTDLGDLKPWVNLVVHGLVPVAVLVDWLVWPPERRPAARWVGLWLVVPGVYVAYSLLRGALTGFYPYPFFDPARSGGYAGVATYGLGMLVGFLLTALLVRWLAGVRLWTLHRQR
jgi:hypothetical protein